VRRLARAATRTGPDQVSLFARRLRRARAAAGMTQTQLAREAGPIHWTTISHYENGQRRPGTYRTMRLAAALNVTPEWLSGVRGASR